MKRERDTGYGPHHATIIDVIIGMFWAQIRTSGGAAKSPFLFCQSLPLFLAVMEAEGWVAAGR